ncbi:MAG: DNA gyrase subunit A [Betaproteobacteria bacterium]|nr:DNA gyrase subunit A [Betaproteobacteria bacterium]
MDQFAKETISVSLEDEMRRSYLDYAMSVIVGRALPDVRDGLKPVHRRVLFAMQESNTVWNRPYVKCARVVGDVLGKYHPHGDTATYEALVRMAQDFSMRYMLIDGQGNFGSVDGDSPAAYRYTECRLARIAGELLTDIDSETVDFVPNYDGKEMEPSVLPAKIPNLLVNGSSGIAVGMATNIPPHNLNEVIDGCLQLLEHPETTIDDLIRIIPAPDFPTKGIIYGLGGVHEGYRTGRGRVIMRARIHFEEIEKGGRTAIIVDELPYQVNKKSFLERVGELVHEKRLEGISHIQDESDKSGMRVVIELKRNEIPEVVLNNLYKLTQLQDSFGINMVALVDGQPRLLNIRQMLDAFLSHRREVVTRRTLFELKKARERAHIQEGLAVALANVDEIIELIRAAQTPAEAKLKLLAKTWQSTVVEAMLQRAAPDATKLTDSHLGLTPEGYRLSEIQAQAILEMRLQRLTGLEQEKIVKEYGELVDLIADLLDILAKPARITAIVGEELRAMQAQYGDVRKSEIVTHAEDLALEDLITPEDVVITFSHAGYIKAQPLADYRAQNRGGRGKLAAATKEDDFIERLFVAHTHDFVLCFSNRGKVYWLKAYQVPQGNRVSQGKPIVNVLALEDGEKINAVLPVKTFDEDRFVFMATADGTVKKTSLVDFSRPRERGIIAIELDEGNFLVGVSITDGKHDVMLFSDAGKAVRFEEGDVRPMGRTARGVRGMRLGDGQKVVSMLVANDESQSVLTATENGYGKRTPVAEYTKHGRGTQGMNAILASDRNGKLIGAVLVDDKDELMLVSTGGILIRTKVAQIREMGRSTQGVRLIDLDEGTRLASIERVAETEDTNGENGHGGNGGNGAGIEAAPPSADAHDINGQNGGGASETP